MEMLYLMVSLNKLKLVYLKYLVNLKLKGYDLEKSGVIEFAYDMESLEKLETFEKWLSANFRDNHKHIENYGA